LTKVHSKLCSIIPFGSEKQVELFNDNVPSGR
jgi:hypothetical protein